jgi:hypothetical protein
LVTGFIEVKVKVTLRLGVRLGAKPLEANEKIFFQLNLAIIVFM